jgi:hypothetical protein
MKAEGFGNLRDWGSVLEKLEHIKAAGVLDEHQQELSRVLRYRENWRLTERVLECMQEVERPFDELIEAVCRIMCDEDAYIDIRILAADALGDLVLKRRMNTGEGPCFGGVPVTQVMKGFLDCPQVPVFRAAVSRAIETAG